MPRTRRSPTSSSSTISSRCPTTRCSAAARWPCSDRDHPFLGLSRFKDWTSPELHGERAWCHSCQLWLRTPCVLLQPMGQGVQYSCGVRSLICTSVLSPGSYNVYFQTINRIRFAFRRNILCLEFLIVRLSVELSRVSCATEKHPGRNYTPNAARASATFACALWSRRGST